MANHPFQLGPRLVVALDPEEVDVPVEVVLQVLRPHPREPPKVALDPGAEAVHELHPLEVGGVAGVGLVRLVGPAERPDERPMRLLHVVDYGGARRYVGEQRVLYPPRAGLAVAADDGDHVLARVDGHGDAELVPGQAAPRPPVRVPHGRGVRHVGLVDPHAPGQHDRVLPRPRRGEDPVAPLEGGPVGDAAGLGSRVGLAVPAHRRHERDPGGEVGLRALEYRARERAVPPAARAAGPSLRPVWGPPVPHGAPAVAAEGAWGPRPEGVRRLGEGAPPVRVAARPRPDGLPEQRELVVRPRGDAGGAGVDVHMRFPSARVDVPPGCRQT